MNKKDFPKSFSNNVWWTRKARVQAEKRLLSNAFQSQIILLWYSFFSVAISIYYLNFASSSNEISGISWVVFSVLVLSMSGFISGLSFKERAALIKESYEVLNRIYFKSLDEKSDSEQLAKEYEQIMGLCENHTDYDYYSALCIEYASSTKAIDSETGLKKGFDRKPGWYHWFSLTWWIAKRYLMFSFFYALPFLLTIFLEIFS
jgi:hypothetical protein